LLVRILLAFIAADHERGGSEMAMAIDPVCGMRVDTDDAPATAEHEGTTYYFCSQVCHDLFVADPAAYARDAGPA
jgi:YHS domain-containing protein